MKMPPFDYACPATLPKRCAARRRTATPRRSPAARAWCRCWRSGWRIRRCWSTCASSPSCAQISITERRRARSAPWCAGATSRTTRGSPPRIRCSQAAIAHVAHYQIRNRGTVGGSIAHADPAAEMPGIAVTCDAEIAVVGKAGARVIQAADFFQGPLTTALTADEIIVEVRLPAWPAGRRWGFQEFARRRGDFAHGGGRACSTIRTSAAGRRNAHVGVIGVADRPLRLAGVGSRARTAKRSTRRRSPRPRPRRPPRSIRPTTSMPAPPIAGRSSAPWSSARSRTPRRSVALSLPCRSDSKSTASRSRSRSSRA